MGNAPSKSGKTRRANRSTDDAPADLPAIEVDAAPPSDRPDDHDSHSAANSPQKTRAPRPTLQGQLPPPIATPGATRQHQQNSNANSSNTNNLTPMPSAMSSQANTPYTPGSAAVAGAGARSSDYFPLQQTATRDSRISLGSRMRGRMKKGASAGSDLTVGALTPGGAEGAARSYCDVPGMPILAGEHATGLRGAAKLSLTEYVSTAGGGEHAVIRHAEKPKQFSVDDMIFRLLDAGFSGRVTKAVCLRNSEIIAVCQAAREVFLAQPTLLQLAAPVKITGDIHGQYTDLLRLFDKCGFPPLCNYLFLGDYVDRGKQSLETILLLMCFKIKFPDNFFLLRGNHECANVTRVYGFYDECKRRCNVKVWKAFMNTFNALPVAAVVAGKIYCVHGGLSPDLVSMDQVRQLPRPCDVPDHGVLNDLLWSDPSETAADWEENERGVSYCFGKSVITDFLRRMDFDLICRAHMVVEDGYEFFHGRQLVTVFSAPNYCGEFDNSGAVMNVNEDLLCSFEILKPLTENLQSCMARVEANFWSRRQQVKAMIDEAIVNEAKNNAAPSADAVGSGLLPSEADAERPTGEEAPQDGATSSAPAADTGAAAAASSSTTTAAAMADPATVPIPMPTQERKRRSPAVAKSPGRFNLDQLSDANSDDDEDDEDDSSSATGVDNAEPAAVPHGTPPRGTLRLKQQAMVQGRSSSSS